MNTERYDNAMRWFKTGAGIASLSMMGYYLILYPSQEGALFWGFVSVFVGGSVIMLMGGWKMAVLRFDATPPNRPKPITGETIGLYVFGLFIGAVAALLLYLVVR